MSSTNSLRALEDLFLEKLEEKYKLTPRDLKKAFSRFDKDGNGLLDLSELSKGIQLFLNGVKESQVEELVARYDANGDGKISYEEFLHLLKNRTALQNDDAMYSETASVMSGDSRASSNMFSRDGGPSPDSRYSINAKGNSFSIGNAAAVAAGRGAGVNNVHANANNTGIQEKFLQQANTARATRQQMVLSGTGNNNNNNNNTNVNATSRTTGAGAGAGNKIRDDMSDDYQASDKPSEIDTSNPRELEYRAKIYLQNLRAILTNKAVDMRLSGKVKEAELAHSVDLQETLGRRMIAKAFQPYTGQGDGRARDQLSGVALVDFTKVLRSFTFKGAAPVRTETIQFLFALCATPETTLVSEDGRIAIDPNMFIDLVFGAPKTRQDQKDRGIYNVNTVGGTGVGVGTGVSGAKGNTHLENTAAAGVVDHGVAGGAVAKAARGFVARVESGRDVVGSGPVILPHAADSLQEKQADILAVPMRFVSRKSRSALVTPSNFDPIVDIKRSNSLPPYDLIRKHVFGMSTSTYSGNKIYVLPQTPPSFRGRSLRRHGDTLTRSHNVSENFIDSATVVYASAGLGVVHNLAENSQNFFEAHADDISCIAVSGDGRLAATGCMGKYPVVHVWSTNVSAIDSKKPIATLGYKFFQRAVCAIDFSWDNKYIVAIGCDDNAILGIFEIATGLKLQESPAQHGVPPQIKWITYAPAAQSTEYLSREHIGPCDLFATAGDHHLRLWSFRRPTGNGDLGSLVYKAPTVNSKAAVNAAKNYLCCAFIYCEDKTYDFCAGGSNGIVYLWRKGVLVANCQAVRGRVQSMIVGGDRVYIGGSSAGTLKILDARTLNILQEYTLIGSDNNSEIASRSNAGAAGGAGRPRTAGSTGSGRSGPGALRSASAGKTRPARAALAEPKSRRNDVYGDILAGPSDADNAANADEAVNIGSGAKAVTGIALVQGSGRNPGQGSYVLATLGTGKMVRVDVGMGASPGAVRDMLFFHTGAVYGLAADSTKDRRLVATVCDDRKLIVWDAEDCVLIGKALTQTPCRCVHIDRTNSFIATGATSGAVFVFYLSDELSQAGNYYRVNEIAYRKDAAGEATAIKFSPSNDRLALGSRDDCIYVYSATLTVRTTGGTGRNMKHEGACVLRAMHKLRGHSSTITHLDWSEDSALLQSTCQAYELLCWDVTNGTALKTGGPANNNINPSDVRWKTHHCILGFSVMGIWPMYSDGTDVNSVDASSERNIIASANDAGGLVRLFNYPCVVKNAPAKDYTGHSSHVTGVRFMRGGGTLISTGGNDGSVVIWEVARDRNVDNPDQFKN